MSIKDSLKKEYSYYIFDNLPCRVTTTASNILAEKYMPGEGLIETSFLDVMFNGAKISKKIFDDSILKLSTLHS